MDFATSRAHWANNCATGPSVRFLNVTIPTGDRWAGSSIGNILSAYRLYRSTDSDRLCFIRRARDLGFPLEEIRRLLDLADQKSRSCRRVHDIAFDHLAEVRTKIADLRRMERVLATMVKACAQGTMPACPLLETLAQAG